MARIGATEIQMRQVRAHGDGRQETIMAGSGSVRRSMRVFCARLAGVAAVILICIVPVWWTAAHAQGAPADQHCIGCHSRRGLTKKLENSERLPLTVPADLLAKSEHATVGCTGCHTEIKLDTHPATRIPIKNAHDFSVTSARMCRGCHEKDYGDWQKSIHAALVGAGNTHGPVCTSCHSAHTEIKRSLDTIGNVPCLTCHDTIFAAYASSVHGRARSNGNDKSPLCSGCHNAHDVSVASSSTGPENACLTCHDGAVQTHEAWLPNAALHFDVVSCPVCHVPAASRRVDLQLVDARGQMSASGKDGVPTFQTPGKSVDAIALYNLLQAAGQGSTTGHAMLRGRLEVTTGEQIHQLAPKSQAIRTCNTCHSPDSDAFKSVSISVPGPEGLPVHYTADKAVLSSVMSLGSIGGFYAIGGTRIELLDILLVLAVLVGIGVPAAHLLLGAAVRRYLRRHGTKPPAPRPE